MKLLILSCCGKKLDREVMAGRMYQNREHNLIREHELRIQEAGIEIAVLSAEYGLVGWTHLIKPYDRKMTPVRAAHLACRLAAWPNDKDLTEVFVQGGKLYRDCIKSAFDGVPVTELVGANRGNGDHFSALKRWINETTGGDFHAGS